MSEKENEFGLKLGHVGNDTWPNLARVHASVSRSKGGRRGQVSPMPKRSGVQAHCRKGSKDKARPVFALRQRIFVKVRFSLHGAHGGSLLRSNLNYVARGHKAEEQRQARMDLAPNDAGRDIAPEIEHLTFYDSRSVDVDAKAIPRTWADDPLHFRILLSAEHGEELGSLKPMVREVMRGLELKLGTKLTWIAIDHWDTPSPHTHVLVRGMRSDGQSLYIPRKIMFTVTREYAQEVVTRILGPRTSQLQLEHTRSIDFTPLDRELLASRDANGVMDARRPDLLARLEQLEDWGFAQRSNDGWRMAGDVADKLNSMSRYRRLEAVIANLLEQNEPMLLLGADTSKPTNGELVHAGIADPFENSFIAVIETGAGELRYHRLENPADIALMRDVAPYAEVSLAPIVPEARPLDHIIAAVASGSDGNYAVGAHRADANEFGLDTIDAGAKRLADMATMSLVARSTDGDFVVGEDQLRRAMMYETRLAQRFQVSPRILSYWTLEDQVSALGPTRLDRVLAGLTAPPRGSGAFARRHADALAQRRQFLIDQGWLGENESMLPRATLARMAAREAQALAAELSTEIGKPVAVESVARVDGIYARRVDLAQGRVALIVGEQQAHLVRWRSSLEALAGKYVSGLQSLQAPTRSLRREMPLPPM